MKNNVFIKSSICLGLYGATLFSSYAKDNVYNIVFIMSDDHASRMISCYDKSLMSTPNIDRIANDGVKFVNGFVANSISGPSRACLLTGKHSCENKFYTNAGAPFDGSQQTFPKLLQKAGYETAIVGKWHLKSEPTGFDYWEVLPDQGEYYNPVFLLPGGKKVVNEGYATNIITDKAINWLENIHNEDKPFCLMVHHKAPHRNWMADTCDLALFEDKEIPLPKNFYDNYGGRFAASKQEMRIQQHMKLQQDLKVPVNGKYDKGYNKAVERMTPEQRAKWDEFYGKIASEFNIDRDNTPEWKYNRYIKDYMKTVQSLDRNIGRLLDYLEEKGLMDNTLVVYTSDQGFYMGEHGWFDKRFMYEESMRTPIVMHLPDGFDKKGNIIQLVQNIDFAPTFLDLAGVEIPSDIHGRSLLPLFNDNKDLKWRDALYYHYYHFPGAHSVRKHFGIRTERYKLIRFYGDDVNEWELFDLNSDPSEMNNIYEDNKHSDLVKELKLKLKELQIQYHDPIVNEVVN